MLSVIVLIGVLILTNGLLVAMEMAFVTARRTRLKIKAEDGNQRAEQVLAIQDQPGDFLATVQIGITLLGTAASAVGGAEIVQALSPVIALVPWLSRYAERLALILVIVVITYLTLVFGELVPKRLALQNPETVSMAFTNLVRYLSWFTHLPMRVLSFSTDIVLRIIKGSGTQLPSTSPEEIEMLVKQGAEEGVLQDIEKKLISGVFDYAERRVQDVMTPRTSIVAIEEKTKLEEALRIAKQAGYSRYPVFRDNVDCIMGYVHIKDLILADRNTNLVQRCRPLHFTPSNTPLPKAFRILAQKEGHMAIVLDEFSGTKGLFTLEDLLEEIVGEIEDEHSPVSNLIVQESKDEWIIPGQTSISDIGDLLQVEFQPKGRYKTIAGFILAELGNIPSVGDQFIKFGYQFTVRKMDHLRIDELNVLRNQKGQTK